LAGGFDHQLGGFDFKQDSLKFREGGLEFQQVGGYRNLALKLAATMGTLTQTKGIIHIVVKTNSTVAISAVFVLMYTFCKQ